MDFNKQEIAFLYELLDTAVVPGPRNKLMLLGIMEKLMKEMQDEEATPPDGRPRLRIQSNQEIPGPARDRKGRPVGGTGKAPQEGEGEA